MKLRIITFTGHEIHHIVEAPLEYTQGNKFGAVTQNAFDWAIAAVETGVATHSILEIERK